MDEIPNIMKFYSIKGELIRGK